MTAAEFGSHRRCGSCCLVADDEVCWRSVVAGQQTLAKVKVKVLPYSLLSTEPGDDCSVQVVSPQVTLSHPPGGRLAIIFPGEERH